MNKKKNGILGFSDLPPATCPLDPSPPSLVPLRLPYYDFTPVEDPIVVCANKTTKSLCGTSGTQKLCVIIGLRAKPIPKDNSLYRASGNKFRQGKP
ncbi:hypothetical protein QVD17_23968 [Tagetes erecta]|uniref:Uncharacterized protein n=1 Tax=Tagetes erecta TaxID=13708 RepID=A0AAD8NUK2_TARER|nr:hypothetical protein QVD17_23968 [Tagetes erecta]